MRTKILKEKIEKLNARRKEIQESGSRLEDLESVEDLIGYYKREIDEMIELRERTEMPESDILDEFHWFCKTMEMPIDRESWGYYVMEVRDQSENPDYKDKGLEVVYYELL